MVHLQTIMVCSLSNRNDKVFSANASVSKLSLGVLRNLWERGLKKKIQPKMGSAVRACLRGVPWNTPWNRATNRM